MVSIAHGRCVSETGILLSGRIGTNALVCSDAVRAWPGDSQLTFVADATCADAGPMRILQINTEDIGGGAAKVAWNLLQGCRMRGHVAQLAVGYKRSSDPDALLIPNRDAHGGWFRFWRGVHSGLQSLEGQVPGTGWLGLLARGLAQPGRYLDLFRGVEDFHFPGTWRLLELTSQPPHIVHCHNLLGYYFDLRAMSWLSRQVPVILTLHDAWPLSGHCAHSFECERWKIGCGKCPDLAIYPAIRRDATAYNWRRKQEIYAHSRLHVVTPCRWLMEKVELSILAPAAVETRVIPHGVDLAIFHPAERASARLALSIPQDAAVLLFIAFHARQTKWRDYETMRTAVARVADSLDGQTVLFIVLGEEAPAERIGRADIRFIPWQRDDRVIARYYQAADLYVHAARADTFPNVVLEALACGTPVVATAVGGIPEQVKSLELGGRRAGWHTYNPAAATGILVPPGDAEDMAAAIRHLLTDQALHSCLAGNAAKDARDRFNVNCQVEAYLTWYYEIIRRRSVAPTT